jgi:flagellar hook-associated protein 2
MASITSLGVGSGLDLEGLVTKLVAAEKDPATQRLDLQEAGLQATLSAYGTLKGGLSDLQGTLTPLKSLRSAALQASVASPDLLTATATSIASPGEHSVEVVHLAQAQRLASKSFGAQTASLGTGTLTFRFGAYDSETNTFTPNDALAAPQVTIGNGSDTLEGIRDAVNAANIGVNASIVNDGSGYRLVFASTATGANRGLEVTVADDDGNNLDDAGLSQLAYDPTAADAGSGKHLTETQPALDAQLKVDGLDITRDSNTVTGVIPGVTLRLLKAAPGEPTALSVDLSSGAVSGAVNAFVSKVNALVASTKSLTSYDPTTRRAGALLGDSALQNLQTQLRRAVSGDGTGSGAFRTLADIGVSFQRDGSLAVDSSRLSAALDQDFDGVAAALGSAGDRIQSLIDRFTRSGGILSASTDSVQGRIDDVARQRQVLDDQMSQLEQRLRSQFSALDVLLGQLNQTSQFLTQQLQSLPTVGSQQKNG